MLDYTNSTSFKQLVHTDRTGVSRHIPFVYVCEAATRHAYVKLISKQLAVRVRSLPRNDKLRFN